jgi:hypothetical protein
LPPGVYGSCGGRVKAGSLSTILYVPRIHWFHITRALGAAILLYGVFGDHTPERGTLILTGAGLLGLDKVARSESPNG